MLSAITGLAGRFFSAGASLMSNLGSGIRSTIDSAVSAVAGAAARLASYLHGSPAKTGPLSGAGYTRIRGQHLVEDLAAGMRSRTGALTTQARDLADIMTMAASSETAFNRITGPLMGAGAMAAATGPGGSTINVGGVALEVKVGEGVDPAAARRAFDGAGDDLAAKLAEAIRRR